MAVDPGEFALLIGPNLVTAKIGPGEMAVLIHVAIAPGQHLAVVLRIGPEDILAADKAIVHNAPDLRHPQHANIAIVDLNRIILLAEILHLSNPHPGNDRAGAKEQGYAQDAHRRRLSERRDAASLDRAGDLFFDICAGYHSGVADAVLD